ncbi:MAG: Rpp14/Pop5 family protein [Desulfurococcaceae archaeon]
MTDIFTSIVLIVSVCLLLTSLLLIKKAAKLYRALSALLAPRKVSAKKVRKRYIVFAVICESKATPDGVHEAIERTFLEYYGRGTFHRASPYLMLFDETSQRGIYRVSHMFVDHMLASMGLVKKIDGNKCVIIPLRTTGSLKRAQKYVKRPRP